jgi:hypothetical protein
MVAMAEVPIAGQAETQAAMAARLRAEAEAAAKAGRRRPRPWEAPLTGWTHPRTPWGDPDIQGMWSNYERVPFQRDPALKGRETWTDAEIAAQEARINQVQAAQGEGKQASTGFRDQQNYNNIVNWPGMEWVYVSRRTSAIIDPPDGRLPAWTLAQVKAYEEREALTLPRGDADWTLDRPPGERCIADFDVTHVSNWGMGVTDPSDLSFGAGNGSGGDLRGNAIRFTQTPGYVTITREGVSGRGEQIYNVIRLDNRPHLSSKFLQYRGDAIGRFEGNTLVVEYTNLKYYGPYIPSYGSSFYPAGKGKDPRHRDTLDTSTLKVTERYTRVRPDRMEYKVTIEDPQVYVRPYTTLNNLDLNDGFKLSPPLCKEGTDDMGLTLAGWRLDEETAMRTAAETLAQRKPAFERIKARAIAEANKNKSQ